MRGGMLATYCNVAKQLGIYKEVFVSKGLYELVAKLLGLLYFVADKVETSARSAHKLKAPLYSAIKKPKVNTMGSILLLSNILSFYNIFYKCFIY